RSRRVRSPEAPKITRVQGGRTLSSVSPSETTSGAGGGSRTPATVALIAPSGYPGPGPLPKARVSGDPHGLLFFLERLQQRVVGVRELLDPVLFELQEDPLLLDLELTEAFEDPASAGEVVVDADLRVAMVPVGLEGLGRQGVHRIGGDQRFDIVEVGVGRVLRRGRGPQGTLERDALLPQRLEARASKGLLEGLVGDPGVGDAQTPAQPAGLLGNGLGPRVASLRVELLVGIGVHAADEEARDRTDLFDRLSGRHALLHGREVSLDDLAVARDRE